MPDDARIRAILDTNLWISFLISKELVKIGNLFDNPNLSLLFSSELLDEFIEVCSRKKFQKYFESKDVEKLLELIDVYGEIVEVTSDVSICRDAKDNFLLALAKDGKAAFLVTGDPDLLVLNPFGQTETLTYTNFASRISAR